MAASDDDFDDDFSDDDVPSRPRPKNTLLTLILCVLNVLAAVGFMFLLTLDYQKRSEWSYAVFLHDLAMQGLPLKEEEEVPSASRATVRYPKLTSEQIKAVFSTRPGTKGGDTFGVVDPDLVAQAGKAGAFIPPAYIENRILPSHLSPDALKDHFGATYLGADKEVTTLEGEIARLKDKVPTDIAAVAKETVSGTPKEDDKRALIAKLLLPLTYDIHQVEKLDKKVKAAKGDDLDTLLEDAVQRRMLMDILGPADIFRPGDVKSFLIEKVADVDSFPLDDLKSLLKKRFDVAVAEKFIADVHQGPDWEKELRWSIEKRATTAFLLASLAFVRKPDDSLLYADNGPAGTPNLDRVQRVIGILEFTTGVYNLGLAYEKMEEKVVEAIKFDRQGYEVMLKNEIKRSQSFLEKHRDEILRIKEMMTAVREAEERLKDLQDQRERAKKLVEERQEQLEATAKKLVAARAETARQLKDLRKLQQQLFQAQVELSDAAERNFQIEQQIRAAEHKLQGKK